MVRDAGADLAPRLAFRLEAAAATGCVGVGLDAGVLRFTRPCYGGNVRETVSLAVPEDPDTTGILRQLSAIASANQVTFTSFSIETPTPPKGKDFLVKQLAPVKMQMSVYGPYEGIKGFLRGIETNVRVAVVESAEIRPLSSGGGELYALNLKVEFYYQK